MLECVLLFIHVQLVCDFRCFCFPIVTADITTAHQPYLVPVPYSMDISGVLVTGRLINVLSSKFDISMPI